MIRPLARLHPRRFLDALSQIDRESNIAADTSARYRVFVTLFTVSVSLLLLNYARNSSNLVTVLAWVAPYIDMRPMDLISAVRNWSYAGLLGYCWWGFWHVVAYVVIPVLVVRFAFRERIRGFGLGIGELRQHWIWYLVLVTPILVFVVFASFRSDFVVHYPFYKGAGRSWMDLVLWETIYVSQFICLEFFFRGFFVFSLRPILGVNAVAVMCVPYLMIHFTKPWLEATGAILFGLFLGVLALRSRSIWGGVAVHVMVAVSMDMAALIQTGRIPQRWLP